jgi:hypothetical protein
MSKIYNYMLTLSKGGLIMCRKLTYLTFVVLVLGSVTNAADVHWTNAGGDKLWNNPANWDSNKVPGAGDNVFVDVPAAKAPNGPIIRDGINVKWLVSLQ